MLQKHLSKITFPPYMGWILGYACVWVASIFLVYFWRVVFLLPADFSFIVASLCLGAVFSVLYAAVFLISRCKRLELKAAIAIFITGLLFCFALAPLQAPDEDKHFLRAQSISMGSFTYQYDAEYSSDVSHLVDIFKAPMNHNVMYQNALLSPALISEYHDALENGDAPSEAAEAPILFMLLPFLHQGFFISIARFFGFSALGQMYAARIANLLLYTFLCYAALKNAKKHKGVLLVFCLLPLSLFMAASCSYDALMLGLCYFLASIVLRDTIRPIHIYTFVAALAVATYIKPLNFLLAALLLLIPKENFSLPEKWPKNRMVYITATAFIAVFAWYVLGFVDGGLLKQGWPDVLPRGSGTAADPAAQLSFMLLYPLRFLSVAVQSLYENVGYLFDLGRLGAMDMNLPLISGLSVVSIFLGCVLSVDKKAEHKRFAAGLLVIGLLYAAAILCGMYVTDTDFQSIRITGMQPRYFLPAFLLCATAASALFSRVINLRTLQDKSTTVNYSFLLYFSIFLAIFCAILLFQNYFIGQWIPSSEGGWKLVNLYGWVQN